MATQHTTPQIAPSHQKVGDDNVLDHELPNVVEERGELNLCEVDVFYEVDARDYEVLYELFPAWDDHEIHDSLWRFPEHTGTASYFSYELEFKTESTRTPCDGAKEVLTTEGSVSESNDPSSNASSVPISRILRAPTGPGITKPSHNVRKPHEQHRHINRNRQQRQQQHMGNNEHLQQLRPQQREDMGNIQHLQQPRPQQQQPLGNKRYLLKLMEEKPQVHVPPSGEALPRSSGQGRRRSGLQRLGQIPSSNRRETNVRDHAL